MAIKVTNTSKEFKGQYALNDVSFEIKNGEIAGFIGPNGAGKTTMMRIIGGLIPQSSGEVQISNFKIPENSFEIRKIIGYLPENNPLYKEMYVKEYLEFIAGIYNINNKTKRTADIIAQTGLEPEQHKLINQLSKGYKQRVGIAQALIHNPEVLILDEPTSGLDPNQIIEIRNLILQAGKEKTVMLSTHIMQEVEAICDRIIIIDNGKIIANDLKENIYKHSKENYNTIIVEFNQPPDKEKLQQIPGVDRIVETENNTWLIQHIPETDIPERIFQFAVDHKIKVRSMQQKEKKLESVFQELTSRS
jgi:ABC-2 type transport system ATP-binding protein